MSTDPGADYKGDWSQISFEKELVESPSSLSEVTWKSSSPCPGRGVEWGCRAEQSAGEGLCVGGHVGKGVGTCSVGEHICVCVALGFSTPCTYLCGLTRPFLSISRLLLRMSLSSSFPSSPLILSTTSMLTSPPSPFQKYLLRVHHEPGTVLGPKGGRQMNKTEEIPDLTGVHTLLR